MESKPTAQDHDIRMGSEYASARDYLARVPRAPAPKSQLPAVGRQGSNDSDFGFQKMGGD